MALQTHLIPAIAASALLILTVPVRAAEKTEETSKTEKKARAEKSEGAATKASTASEPKRMFVELMGFYGAGMGTNTTSQQNNQMLASGTADAAAYTQTYGYRTPRAFGGGIYAGYTVFEPVDLVASFQIFTYNTKPIVITTADGKGGNTTTRIEESIHSDVLTFGARTRARLGPGHAYMGAGLAFMLPHAFESIETVEGDGVYTTKRNVGMSILGMYGEVGWRYGNDGFYVGIAGQVHTIQARRDGTTTKITYAPDGGGAAKTATTKHETEFAQKDVSMQSVGSKKNIPSIERPYSQLFADVRWALSAGYRF